MQLVVNELTLGAIYALVALGLLLIFGAARVVNFAQGQMLMLGAYLGLASMVDAAMPPWLAYPVTLLAMGVVGWS